MKKTTPSFLVFGFLLLSLACQALSPSPTESPASTPLVSEPTQIVEAATPTEVAQIPASEGWIALENQDNLWLVHPDGSDLVQITANPVSNDNYTIYVVKWSPDGKTLAYSQNLTTGASIILFDIQTSTTRTLVSDVEGDFDWSADGQEILYDKQGLWRIRIADGESKKVYEDPNANSELFSGFMDIQWSPDGSRVAYRIASFEPAGYGMVNLTDGSFIGMPLNVLGGMGDGNCEWSPVESVIACTTLSDEIHQTELRLFDENGNVLQKTVFLDEGQMSTVHWSPDGRQLALGYYAGNGWKNSILTLETGDISQLSSGIPTGWSPDGNWIVTWSSEEGGSVSPTISIVNVNSGEALQVTEGTNPVWQPVASGDVIVQSPQATATPMEVANVTDTPSAPGSPCVDVSITVKDTSKGDYLEICSNGKIYEMGPLEKGAYALGPNKLFFVYVTNSGTVYTARIGDTRLTLLGDVKKFTIIKQGKVPSFDFKFIGDHPYTVQIFELLYSQNEVFPIPRRISAPN